MPHLGFLAARTVGHSQHSGEGQHQPVAAHTRSKGPRVQAAGLVPLPAYGLQAPEALLNPVSAGLQGGLRVCATGVSVSRIQGCA